MGHLLSTQVGQKAPAKRTITDTVFVPLNSMAQKNSGQSHCFIMINAQSRSFGFQA
jgi:hypothetical protein